MGCCCSSNSDGSGDADLFNDIELEMQSSAITLEGKDVTKGLAVGDDENNVLSGKEGYVLVPVQIEQDSCYFELHVLSCPPSLSLKLGLSTLVPLHRLHKLHQEYCLVLAPGEVEQGDVFGLAVTLDDVPMLRFYRNGGIVPVKEFAKVRGELFPTAGVNPVTGKAPGDGLEVEMEGDEGGDGDGEGDEGVAGKNGGVASIRFVFDEAEFEKKPRLVKAGPLIKSRGLI